MLFCLIFALSIPDGPPYFWDQWEVHPTELYNNWRKCSILFARQKSVAKNMADFGLCWRQNDATGYHWSTDQFQTKSSPPANLRLKSIRWPTRGNSCPLAFTAHAPIPGKCSSKFLYWIRRENTKFPSKNGDFKESIQPIGILLSIFWKRTELDILNN